MKKASAIILALLLVLPLCGSAYRGKQQSDDDLQHRDC